MRTIRPERLDDPQLLAMIAGGRRWLHVQANSGLTTRSAAPQGVAQTPAGTLANADGTDGPWIQTTTGAVSGNTGSFSDSGVYRRDWGVWGRWRLKSGSDISSIRWRVGFSSASQNNSDYGGTASIAQLTYSTPGSFGGWRALTNDGTSSTGVSSPDLAPIKADTVYEIDIRLGGGDVLFGLNGRWLHRALKKLPVASTLLFGYAEIITQTAAGRAFKYARSTYLFGV